MRSNIRMLIAEWLLGKAMGIAPNNEEGNEMRYYILSYFQKAIEKSIIETQKRFNHDK